MKPMLSEKKRKGSPNPLLGRLTRSKSQIYSHLTSSGRHSTDAFAFTPSRRHPSRMSLKSSFPTAAIDASEVIVSPICMKDLRSRRVFSEPIVVSDQEEKNTVLSGKTTQKLGCEVTPNSKFTEIDSLEDKVFLYNGRSIDSFGDGEDEKAGHGVNCVQGRVCGVNPNLSRSIEKGGEIEGLGRGVERLGFQKVDSSCNDLGLDYVSPITSHPDQIIVEENIQTTPPDPDIFSLQKDAENGDTGMHFSASPNAVIDSIPRTKLVLNPCRFKVFKTPSSVSYRKLLPYLLDIAKENSSTTESNACPTSGIVLVGNSTIQSQLPLKPILSTVSEGQSQLSSDVQSGNSTDQIPSQPNAMDFTYTTRETGVITDRKNERPGPNKSPRLGLSHADQVLSAKGLKVFKNPSSVSYRKLLPFLKAAANSKPCEVEIDSCPKLEPVFEEKLKFQYQAPLSHASCIQMSKSVLHTASKVMLTEDDSDQKLSCSMQTGGSTNTCNNPTAIDGASNNMLQTSATDSQNEMPIPSITPQREASLVDQPLPDKYIENTTSPSPNLVSDHTVCVSDTNSKASQSCNDMDQTTATNALEDAITVYQSTSPSKDPPSSEPCTVISSTKGILKRNPGGCRGLCTCLSCSSFRLHAERAFEFSRNQLQDTEDIAVGLMKELSQLRSALELSCDGSNNSQGSSKTHKFVEICASASKAEETARNRLKEMNEELFFHCRMKSLHRPRVNFAIDDRRKEVEEGS